MSFIRRYVRRFASGLVTRRNPYPAALCGSVTLQNAVELLRQQEINGCLSAARPGTRKAIATLFNALHRNLFCRRSNIKDTRDGNSVP